jgi:hypothetical protein
LVLGFRFFEELVSGIAGGVQFWLHLATASLMAWRINSCFVFLLSSMLEEVSFMNQHSRRPVVSMNSMSFW